MAGGEPAVLTCDHCGAVNEGEEEFCTSCGTYLDWAAAAAGPVRPGRGGPGPLRTEAALGPSEALEDTLPGRRALVGPTDRADGNGGDAAHAAARAGSTYDGLFRPQSDVPRLQPVAADAASGATGATTVLPSVTSEAATHTTPTTPAAAPASPVALLKLPQHGPCPVCSRVNDGHLRFCAKCGHALVVTSSGGSRLRPRELSRWRRLLDSRERAARREYRRSLPPFYRWRRAALVALALGLVACFLLVAGTTPRQVFLGAWYDLRQSVVNVEDIQVEVLPSSATVAGSGPGALVDRTEEAWTATWRPKGVGRGCEAAPGTPTIALRFAPQRIRQIVFRPGLPDSSPQRVRQARPKVVAVSAGGRCQTLNLADSAARQPLQFDSGMDVTSVVVGVVSAYPAAGDGRDLSITEITLKTRPPV